MGQHFHGPDGDLSGFAALGMKWIGRETQLFMQVPIVGSEALMKEWAAEKIKDIAKVLEAVRGMSSKHVALYILGRAGKACGVLFSARCSPTDIIRYLVNQLDAELRQAFEDVVGFRFDVTQWEQAALGVKLGGRGIRRGNDIADAAYLPSWTATHEDCIRMDAKHVWDNGHVRQSDHGCSGGVGGHQHDKVKNRKLLQTIEPKY